MHGHEATLKLQLLMELDLGCWVDLLRVKLLGTHCITWEETAVSWIEAPARGLDESLDEGGGIRGSCATCVE